MFLLTRFRTLPRLKRATAFGGTVIAAVAFAASAFAGGHPAFQSGTLTGSIPEGWSSVMGSAPASQGLTGQAHFVVMASSRLPMAVKYQTGVLPSLSAKGAVVSLRHSSTAGSTGWRTVAHLSLPHHVKLGGFATERETLNGEHVVVTVGLGKQTTASTRSTIKNLLASVHST
jgi:hypothetical protein